MASIYEMVSSAKERVSARIAAEEAEEAARLNEQIAVWKTEFRARLMVILGADLVDTLHAVWVPGEVNLWQIRARFLYTAQVFETYLSTRGELMLARCDSVLFDSDLAPQQPTENIDLISYIDISALNPGDRADAFLVELDALAWGGDLCDTDPNVLD